MQRLRQLTVASLALLILAGCSEGTNEENLPKPPTQQDLSKMSPEQKAQVEGLLEQQRQMNEQNQKSGPRYGER